LNVPLQAPPQAAPPRARFRLRWKLAALATFLAVVPLAAVGLALLRVNADAVEQLSREKQLLVLDDVTRTIDQEMVEAQDALGTLGSFLADPALGLETKLSVSRALVVGSSAIDHVAFYDAAGEQLAVVEEEQRAGAPVPATLPAPLRQAAEARGVGSGDVVLHAGEPRMLVAVPIRARDRVTGYAATLMSLDDVQRRVEHLSNTHFPDLPDPLFVVDRQLRIIAHSDRERAAALTSAREEPLLRGVDEALLGPAFGSAGEYDARDGTAMLGSTRGLASQPWAVITQVPQSIAYASLERMTLIVGATILGAIFLALLLGLLLAGRIAKPLERLTRYAGALAQRRFDERVEVRTSDELAVLAHSMNHAAAELRASEDRIRHEVAIRTDLGRYIPAELVEQIVRRERDMALGGERRAITVMFADVVGFTPLTEQLAPEHVVTILNELFTILTGIVFRHGGTVDKFVGDCVMALWGAPTPHADHARRAVEAAEDMLSWLETGNARWQQRYGVSIQLAIGIHTGEVIVGNIGSEQRMEYTAIGDVVNVAARLETIARPQQILITDAVRHAAGPDFEYVDADLHRLSGRAEPVHLWEVRA
jgi:class 3 adenylate cyclase